MQRFTLIYRSVLLPLVTKPLYVIRLLFVGLLLSNPVYAEKPAWAGGGDAKDSKQSQKNQSKHNNQSSDRAQRADNRRDAGNYQQGESERRNDRDGRDSRYREGNVSVNAYFGEQHRTYVHDYYQPRFHTGHCPPGLAKRHNGCVPPGQERRWRMGYPLPREVVYYDLPPSVLVQLGPPPARHRYVRVAADILLIAIGTGMVVDAIEDIGDR